MLLLGPSLATWLGCSALLAPPVGALVDRRVRGQVHARSFTVRLEEQAPLTLTCADPTDAFERHVLTASPADRHDLTLFGLLADTAYDCEAEAPGWSATVSFRTDPLPDWVPSWSLQPGSEAQGYTLLSHGLDVNERDAKLLIVDEHGRLRWALRAEDRRATDLDAAVLPDGTLLYGGGYHVPPTRLGLDGTVLAQARDTSSGQPVHHHVEQLPSGEVVALASAEATDGETVWEGFVVDVFSPQLDEIVWTFDAQAAVDAGWLPPGKKPDQDRYHANALVVDGDRLYVHLFYLHTLMAIHRPTGEVLWTLGEHGDVELLDVDGTPIPAAAWGRRVHAPEKRGSGWLIYENGASAEVGSRIRELHIDEDAKVAQLLGDWTEPGWYEPIWGDVDELPNGHWLITRAHCNRCPRAPREHTTQIMQVDPGQDEVVWRLVFGDALDTSYRAQRIGRCDLFHHVGYCPEER
ncbi:MAG: aryl-sulfate sulfotransferase [Myxococcales bacterium]|nr:aryl-sulfate sulfotransferase [Myxococcales bacterium]